MVLRRIPKECVPGGASTARISFACVSAIACLVAAVMTSDPRVVLGDDLEEYTERLTMIVDTLRYEHRQGSCPGSVMDEDGLVGFHKVVSEDCFDLRAFETRASTDVESLLDSAKLVKSARLTYEEDPVGRVGGWTTTDSCVGQVLGLSAVEMVDEQPRTSTYESGATRTGATEWQVTGLVNSWFIGSAENNGLLLVGLLEPGQYVKDHESCLSSLTKFHLEVTYMREAQRTETDLLPGDLARANTPTPTRTPGPIEREKQDVDTDVLVYKSPTPTHMLPHEIPQVIPGSGIATKPGDSQIVRIVTSTPTRTPEPMVVPKPRSGITQ